MTNRAFIVNGINNLLKRNYSIDTDTIDVEAYVDDSLTFGENWTMIKEMINCHSVEFSFLKCLHCSQNIKDGWIYCPFCGRTL